MSVTLKVVELIDRLHLNNYFIEKDNRVYLKALEFNPAKLESILDKVIKVKGKDYNPNEFELNCIRELENV